MSHLLTQKKQFKEQLKHTGRLVFFSRHQHTGRSVLKSFNK